MKCRQEKSGKTPKTSWNRERSFAQSNIFCKIFPLHKSSIQYPMASIYAISSGTNLDALSSLVSHFYLLKIICTFASVPSSMLIASSCFSKVLCWSQSWQKSPKLAVSRNYKCITLSGFQKLTLKSQVIPIISTIS